MKVFDNLKDVHKDSNTVLTLGTFDGVHLGHKKIIDKMVELSVKNNCRNLLITFYPHPRKVVSKNGDEIKLLTIKEEKLELLEKLGVQNIFVIEFTKEFSQLTSEEFFKKYIIDGVGIKEIVIGYDHHFGKGRGGNEETLREMGLEFGFGVSTVDAVTIDETTVSSTKIRHALQNGDISKTNIFLGRYYSFNGTVIEGDKRGRQLGFPTANIQPDSEDKLLPQLGIYAVELIRGNNKHYGLMSIGKRPTFYDAGRITTEVYIFDFNQDIYGENVTVNVIERIRGEEKFSSAEDLIKQMEKDKLAGLEIVRKLVQ